MDLLLHPLIWVFLITENGSTHRSSLFFDMCIRVYVGGVLSNLHLVIIPMFELHIDKNIFNLIARFLDALSGMMMI